MATTDQFNRTAEQSVQNRITPYKLNENEKMEVWQLVDKRNKDVQEERKDFRENWQERFDTELDRLGGEQRPQPQLNHPGDRQMMTDMQMRQQAQRNIQQDHLNTTRNIERTADKNIDMVLDNAR
ncbi:MAG: hypothetical protein GC192_21460, partial [Bacteroidetes bacterium]|nr:hypothetical protein [Bacteroidota bacterium]